MTKFVGLCQRAIENWNGFHIPSEDMEAILQNNSFGLIEILEQWGYSEDGDSLDTADRDVLHDSIAEFLGFKHWPLNMNAGEPWTQEFTDALKTKLDTVWRFT